jgi:hypothetical protein
MNRKGVLTMAKFMSSHTLPAGARNSVWKCRRFRSRNRWTTSAASGPPAATTSRRRSNKRQFPTWKKAGHALGFAILTAEQREKVENLVEDGVEAPKNK